MVVVALPIPGDQVTLATAAPVSSSVKSASHSHLTMRNEKNGTMLEELNKLYILLVLLPLML